MEQRRDTAIWRRGDGRESNCRLKRRVDKPLDRINLRAAASPCRRVAVAGCLLPVIFCLLSCSAHRADASSPELPISNETAAWLLKQVFVLMLENRIVACLLLCSLLVTAQALRRAGAQTETVQGADAPLIQRIILQHRQPQENGRDSLEKQEFETDLGSDSCQYVTK